MLNPIWLKTFSTVAACHSFTEAGRRLDLTQSSVSEHIRRLEESVGRRLFVNGQPQTPVNDTKMIWSPSAAGTYQLTYTIFCGESVESDQSKPLSYEVVSSTPPPGTGGGGSKP